MNNYIPIIGIELHTELRTKSKMFCGCDANHFGVEPNTHTCPVCLGLPGALPVPNKKAIEWTMMIGQALNCRLNHHSKFDRKHYFYPDLPKSYQISQYDRPFAISGEMEIRNPKSEILKKVRITRAHLEEDTGKLKHEVVSGEKVSLVDFNRSSVPLVEIVTEPDFRSADECMAYAKKIQQIVRYLGVSDADMEKGSMRLEANISLVRTENYKEGSDGYIDPSCFPDYKVEVKNINSFRFLGLAIEYELDRQAKLLDAGQTPDQETRGWSEAKNATVSQRSKEAAKDYRYFPDPDLPPIEFTDEQLQAIIKDMPLLPAAVEAKLRDKYQVREDYVEVLTATPDLAHFTLSVLEESKDLEVKTIVNAIVNQKIDPSKTTPTQLLKDLTTKNARPLASDADMQAWVQAAIEANPDLVEKYKSGKTNVVGAFMGDIMRASKGKADAKAAMQLLEQKLSAIKL